MATSIDASERAAPVRFSLVQGGPTYRIARALHAVGPDGRIGWRLVAWVVTVTWLPLVLFSLPSPAGSPIEDIAVHVRYLVTVPLFIAAERSLHARSQRCIDRLISEAWTRDQDAVARLVAGPRGAGTRGARSW